MTRRRMQGIAGLETAANWGKWPRESQQLYVENVLQSIVLFNFFYWAWLKKHLSNLRMEFIITPECYMSWSILTQVTRKCREGLALTLSSDKSDVTLDPSGHWPRPAGYFAGQFQILQQWDYSRHSTRLTSNFGFQDLMSSIIHPPYASLSRFMRMYQCHIKGWRRCQIVSLVPLTRPWGGQSLPQSVSASHCTMENMWVLSDNHFSSKNKQFCGRIRPLCLVWRGLN